jgi:signal transduction histidine kinase/CheY-like chemotaxis protein
MSGESGPGAVGAPASLRATLAEMAELLAGVRERLRESASAPGAEAALTAERDEHALAIFQEILSVPPLGLPPGELFALAMDRLSRLLAADRAVLFVLDEASGRLVPRSGRGVRREDIETLSLDPSEGLIGRVFREKRVLTHDEATASESADPFVERFPVRQGIAVPVRTEGEVGGVLFAGRRALGAPFGTTDVLLLLVIADRVGSTLVHQRLLERHGEHLAHLREVRALVDEQGTGREPAEILARVGEAACRMPGVRAALVVAGTGADAITAVAGAGRLRSVGREQIGGDDELLAAGFAADRPVQIRDLQARGAARPGVLERDGLRAGLLVPLRIGSRVLGLLALADVEPREFSSEETEMALTLAAVTAAALDTRRGLETLRRAAAEQAAREAEDAQGERARALTAFGAGLTRELSSIFALLLGKSQLLLARAPDDSLREGLATLEEAAWRGTDVVQRLLGLAEAEAGPALSCDPGAVAQEALAFARPRLGPGAAPGGGRIEITADLPPTPPVRGSGIALREAIGNLVLNAMEAMPGGGALTVRMRPLGRGIVELVVADRGRGIAPEVRPRIFDPFFTTRPGHLGLGLTVVQAIVVRAGGRLEVQSGPDGTTVTLRLPTAPDDDGSPTGESRVVESTAPRPAAPPRESPAPEPPAVSHTAAAPPAPGSVLVVEEEDTIRVAVVGALSEAGHRVEAAVDATSALERLARGGIDVVVTDLALRDRSGLQLAAAVKQRSPGAAVVLLTGWGRRLHEERVRGAGVDVMVVKPVQAERVRTAVAEALRLRPSA